MSSVLGPLAGGLIIAHLSWAWVFWINVPVGIAAGYGFVTYLNEGTTRDRQPVDTIGAALFAVTVAAVMIALTQAGSSSYRSAGLAALAAAGAGVLFVMQERRAVAPMISFRLWSQRAIVTANTATLLSGMAVIGLTTFLPMYVQGVLGRTPLVAGFALTMMVLGWPIGATLCAKSFPRLGLRTPLLLGAALLPLGGVAFLALAPGGSPMVAGLGSLVMGLGMGFLNTAAIVIIQDSVGWADRGAATASNIFSRNLGSTFGATVLGVVLNISLAHPRVGEPVDFDEIRALLDHSGQMAGLLGGDAVRLALGHSLHLTFWAMFGVALATLAAATLVPRVTMKQKLTAPALVD